MSDHEKKPKKIHFFVDGKQFETERSSLTGAEIKAIAAVPTEYQLFLEEKGDKPDRAVSDGEAIDLGDHGPKHFFAVPQATFGAK